MPWLWFAGAALCGLEAIRIVAGWFLGPRPLNRRTR